MLDQIIFSHLAVGEFIVNGTVAANSVVSLFSKFIVIEYGITDEKLLSCY